MTLSQTAICNMALSRIGSGTTIMSINDNNVAARTCLRFWDHVVDETLQGRPWNFAQRYETLALVEENPNCKWAYSYRYPVNFIKLDQVEPSATSTAGYGTDPYVRYTDYPRLTNRIPFTISSDNAGRLVFTNLQDAVCFGTYRVTDVALWDPMFVDALAWRLAVDLALPLSDKREMYSLAFQRYQLAVAQAHAASANEGAPDEEPNGTWLEAR